MWILEVLGFIGCCLLAFWAGRRYEKWLSKMVERKKAKDILEAESKKEVVVKGESKACRYAKMSGEEVSVVDVLLTEPVVLDGEVIYGVGKMVGVVYRNEDIRTWYRHGLAERTCYVVDGRLIVKRVR